MKVENWKETVITCFSMLVMGFLNGHTQINMSIFVGPQTGNLINMALNLSVGDGGAWLRNVINFSAFILGCAFGTYIQRKLKNTRVLYLVGWSFIAIPTLIYLVIFRELPVNVNVFAMSFISGIAVCHFRKIGSIEMNNLIVTGNMRTISMAAYDGLIMKDVKKLNTFAVVTLGVFLFFFGAFLFGLANRFGNNNVMILGLTLCLLPYFFMVPAIRASKKKVMNV